MTIIYYILFPFVMLILGAFVIARIVPYILYPILIFTQLIHKTPPDSNIDQGIRIDMIITHVIGGLSLVYTLFLMTLYLNIKIAFWYWILSFLIKTYSDWLGWRGYIFSSLSHNFSFVISKQIGYVIGFFIIYPYL